jgi:hypothetical protein
MPMTQTRRRFLTTLTFAGAASAARAPRIQAAEGPLETTAVRLSKVPTLCFAPQYAADELLRAEGFTDIRYVELSEATVFPIEAVARGEIDFNLNYSINYVAAIDAGKSVTLLAGIHVGCYELFGAEGIRTIADLVLKATDLCASDPARVERRLVDGGFTPRYDYALEALGEVSYDKWREYDPEDTVRFYALRLREVGFIKSSPQKIIAENTDWRFLNELKRELKA